MGRGVARKTRQNWFYDGDNTENDSQRGCQVAAWCDGGAVKLPVQAAFTRNGLEQRRPWAVRDALRTTRASTQQGRRSFAWRKEEIVWIGRCGEQRWAQQEAKLRPHGSVTHKKASEIFSVEVRRRFMRRPQLVPTSIF